MSKFSGVNRIIFDLDNILIKHNYDYENELLARQFNLQDDEEFKKQLSNMFLNNSRYIKNRIITREYFVYVIEELMPILKSIGKTGEDLLEMIDTHHAGTLMDGAEELLEYLSNKGYQMVVLTNWFGEYQFKILKKLGIDKYFERLYAWDDYYAKPNHFSIIRALDGTQPRNNIMIGDNVQSDIILAKSTGVKAIGFNVNYSQYKKVVKADADVTKLIDIKNYL